MIDSELLKLLRCPETRQTLTLASKEILGTLNERIRSGQMRNRGGSKVEQLCEAGFVREDGRVFYPVRDGIPVMLIGESLAI